ncbi:MAG TPA: amidohydrolase family protein [Terriglobales bacterium]|nr:amidohydrolase family protein [Terriglobales bacterium]
MMNKLFNQFSRRKFLGAAGATTLLSSARGFGVDASSLNNSSSDDVSASSGKGRIVDMHVHFDAKNPNYIEDFLKVSERLNLTALMLTPFENRKVVAEAAKQHPNRIVPFGYVDLDAPDVVHQVEEFHGMGFRGLGELEFVKKPYIDPSYFPVYERANEYGWVVLFHTGIVLRKKFDEPEDVASGRMRPIHLEEIARRFPKITVLGAHCGNPEYQWAAEIARWNSNVFFDLSGSSLTKMQRRLATFQEIFWWTGEGDSEVKTPDNDPNAFAKLVFGSDTGLEGIENVVKQYHALFDACEVPEQTRNRIMGGTLIKLLGLPG